MRNRNRSEYKEEPMPTEVCYCNGKRELGTMELHCNGCRKWFHQRCLKQLTEFYGLPFMVCYVFYCGDCAPDNNETWTAKQCNFSHMCLMALANMTVNKFKETQNESVDLGEFIANSDPVFFDVEKEVIPFFEDNWESLTPLPRRVKNTWHATIFKTLSSCGELFVQNEKKENEYTLKEIDLTTIGPQHKAVRQLGKRPQPTQAPSNADGEDNDGPKTRGASKRKQVENVLTAAPKRYRTTGNSDSTPLNEGVNQNAETPFNRGEVRYYQAEEDPFASDKYSLTKTSSETDSIPSDDTACKMPSASNYRVVIPSTVLLSTNDRAYQLKVEPDLLTVTGNGGYSMARATHSVTHGRWFFEVEFVRQPGDSHIRIGWAQACSALQACCGYSKFSYGWRSLKGTAFHDGYGHTYAPPGFKQGDILGFLIDLPTWEQQVENGRPIGSILPSSHKDDQLIKFKNHYIFQEHETINKLQELPSSKIEFFLNGRSKGVAFTDIYEGAYFPAVSMFHDAVVRVNFGPKFRYALPKDAKPMSLRPEQLAVEQSVSDLCDLVKIHLEEEQRQKIPLVTDLSQDIKPKPEF